MEFIGMVFAFVGMLTFQAYVVPTGSMAPTVLGYHKDVICPRCGSRVSVNASVEGLQDPARRPEKVVGCTCANCRFRIDFPREKLTPPLLGGDRFLAAAGPVKELRRHDLIVHKHPPAWFGQRELVRYVSRVHGLPGETLAIHGGRIYRCTDLKYGEVADVKDRWREKHMFMDDPRAVDHFRQGKFQIVRKSPEFLLISRRLVYHHDFPAGDLPSRWSAAKESQWKADKEHGFRHDGQSDKIDWVTYRHLVRGQEHAQLKLRLITDFTSYNSGAFAGGGGFDTGANWVGDLMLECRLTVTNAEGEAWLELVRGSDCFQARFDLKTGRCALVRLAKNAKPQELAVKQTRIGKTGSYGVRFANCSDRLTLWIDDELPFGDGVDYQPAKDSGPTAADLEPARIGSKGAGVRIHHLQMWRDSYCTQRVGQADVDLDRPGQPDSADPATWGPLRNLAMRTFFVQPGHYFTVSDNPAASSDSREWGVVPESFVLARPMLRYFPFDRTGPIR